ncbi:MAG: hypothetical protein MJZ67_02465 [Bacteroidales bacterium]|nr:hypothetical protein [Bacteroidales bacterium]
MRKFLSIVVAIFVLSTSSLAQDKALMSDYQSQLLALFEDVYNAPTDNQRYHANEAAVHLFHEALNHPNSIKFQWNFGNKVSVLTAPDKKFRIITWPVVNDMGEYECFGFVQSLNEKTDEYDVYELNDMSEEIVNRQEDLLTFDNWFGAVYQELITTSHDGKTFYTLLGWSGVDNLTQRKVIEPICFKSSSSAPQFGQNLFKKERNLRRVVLEYTHNAMVNLWYEEQYVRTVERVRAKRKGGGRAVAPAQPKYKPGKKGKKGKKNTKRVSRVKVTAARTSAAVNERVTSGPSTKTTDEKLKMIIFDEVGPQVNGMEGLFQYYVPTGVELAYVFVDGKWVMREGAQGRDKNKKLNKDFDKPIEKSAPGYKVTN